MIPEDYSLCIFPQLSNLHAKPVVKFCLVYAVGIKNLRPHRKSWISVYKKRNKQKVWEFFLYFKQRMWMLTGKQVNGLFTGLYRNVSKYVILTMLTAVYKRSVFPHA